MASDQVLHCLYRYGKGPGRPVAIISTVESAIFHNVSQCTGRVAQSVGHLTRNILSFLLPLFQEGQLSVTGESMCTKYWLTA